MENKRKYLLATFIVAGSSLLSRVLGLLRQTLMSRFGATGGTGEADCFENSFMLPDIIYNLIVFGVISIVLIPYFSSFVNRKEFDKLNRSCSAIFNLVLILICFFSVIGIVFADQFVRMFLVKGWADNPAKIAMTVALTRIMFLQPIFMSMSGIMSSYLNSREKFFAYSIAILGYNIGIICGILFLSPFWGIYGAAWGVVGGSLLQFIIQFVSAFRSGFRLRMVLPAFDRELRGLIATAVPRVIALGGEQLVKIFISNISSFMAMGAIVVFRYSENIGMVPFGMIAVSISTTVFPIFSKYFDSADYQGMFNSLVEKLRLALYFTLPCIMLMIILRTDIVRLLIGYGRINENDINLIGISVAYYLIGIPFFSMTIILAKYLYAMKKSFSPMVVTIIMSAVTIGAMFTFLKAPDEAVKIVGLSVSRAVGYVVQAVLLMIIVVGVTRRFARNLTFPHREIVNIIKIVLLNVVIFIVLFFICGFVRVDSGMDKLDSIIRGGVIALTGGALYVGLSIPLKILSPEVFARFRRKSA